MAGATLWTDGSCLVLLKLKCLQNMLDGTRSVHSEAQVIAV